METNKSALQKLQDSDRILYSVVSGSHAYGTNTPQSDMDLRGFYWVPANEYLGLNPPVTPNDGQINDEKNDIVYYSLYRAFTLLKTANPNMIELLWIPEDCIKVRHPLMDILLDEREAFISKKAYFTHASYAYEQVKKAKGQNKKVHNPQPVERPKKEDFCHVIKSNFFMGIRHVDIASAIFPMRPMPLNKSGLDLSRFHVAALEHVMDTYRLYDYGDQAKGVFRGDDMLVCESIPISDEWDKFYGLLIYNKSEYEKACREWHSYWDWMKNRNDARWVDQEKGLLNYDQKNMMHCMRLMISAEHILTEGSPLVRFEGEQLAYLMKIRRGELTYEAIMEDVEMREAKLKQLYETSTAIPHSVDMDNLDRLYRHLMEEGAQYHFENRKE